MRIALYLNGQQPFIAKDVISVAKDLKIDAVYRGVRAYILEHQNEGAPKLNQNVIAEKLQASRTPVVKALHMLESEGLVDNIPNRGFYIHEPTIREISELFSVRQGLEMIAAANVSEHGTEEDFQALERCFSGFSDAAEINCCEYIRADICFHQKLIALSGNQMIARINESFQIIPRVLSIGLLRHPRETMDEHFRLVRAMRSRDKLRSQELARLHTENTCGYLDRLQRQLRSLGMDPDAIPAKKITLNYGKSQDGGTAE